MRRQAIVQVSGEEMAASDRCPGEIVPGVVIVLEADADPVIAEAVHHQVRGCPRRLLHPLLSTVTLLRRGHVRSSRAFATISLPSSSRRASAAPRTIPISRTSTKNRWMW